MGDIVKHVGGEDAKAMFCRAFEDVVINHNAWIAMVGFVDEKGGVFVMRTTSNFPQERFLDVVAELRKGLIEELHGGLLPDAPLPRVKLSAATLSSNLPPALPTVSMSDVRYPDCKMDVAGEDVTDSGEQE